MIGKRNKIKRIRRIETVRSMCVLPLRISFAARMCRNDRQWRRIALAYIWTFCLSPRNEFETISFYFGYSVGLPSCRRSFGVATVGPYNFFFLPNYFIRLSSISIAICHHDVFVCVCVSILRMDQMKCFVFLLLLLLSSLRCARFFRGCVDDDNNIIIIKSNGIAHTFIYGVTERK